MISEEIKAKAKEYALSVLQPQIDAIADAYIKGYKEAIKTMPHEPIIENFDKFVDLELESGTMWTDEYHKCSKNCYKCMGYDQALLYGLPTKEQFQELFNNCKFRNGKMYGQNSVYITLSPFHVCSFVWVKSDIENSQALAYKLEPGRQPELVKRFVGYESYFLCVKNKYDIE